MGVKRIDTVRIMGQATVSAVYFNDRPWVDYTRDSVTGEVIVNNLQHLMDSPFTVRCDP